MTHNTGITYNRVIPPNACNASNRYNTPNTPITRNGPNRSIRGESYVPQTFALIGHF